MRKFLISVNCLESKIKVFTKKTNNFGSTVCVYNKNRVLKTFISRGVALHWNESTNHLVLQHYRVKRYAEIIAYILENLLFSMNRLWFTKISFKGKGFKIKKRRRTKSIKFFFYHSHVNTIILKKAKLKQKKKNKILIKTWNKLNLIATEKKIVNIRGLNIFTKRGLRAARQIVFKKTGKKSNY